MMKEMENKEERINVGDYVSVDNGWMTGYVASIIDYGTHVAYFVEDGGPLKFPARREWITKIG